jgi:ssRNA-specific RNase YbeY (16S rRNA maturation enzyme)
MLVILPDVFCCFLQQLQLGDIVISVETARRQAEERGHTLLDETRILMVSMFHLVGTNCHTFSVAVP